MRQSFGGCSSRSRISEALTAMSQSSPQLLNYEEQYKYIIQCSICLSVRQNMFSCSEGNHLICQQCLETYRRNTQQGRLRCPVSRVYCQFFPIRHLLRSLDDYITNLFNIIVQKSNQTVHMRETHSAQLNIYRQLLNKANIKHQKQNQSIQQIDDINKRYASQNKQLAGQNEQMRVICQGWKKKATWLSKQKYEATKGYSHYQSFTKPLQIQQSYTRFPKINQNSFSKDQNQYTKSNLNSNNNEQQMIYHPDSKHNNKQKLINSQWNEGINQRQSINQRYNSRQRMNRSLTIFQSTKKTHNNNHMNWGIPRMNIGLY